MRSMLDTSGYQIAIGDLDSVLIENENKRSDDMLRLQTSLAFRDTSTWATTSRPTTTDCSHFKAADKSLENVRALFHQSQKHACTRWAVCKSTEPESKSSSNEMEDDAAMETNTPVSTARDGILFVSVMISCIYVLLQCEDLII